MRRGILILILGVVAGAGACCYFYRMGTATPRALLRSALPELAWLKHEFTLSDAEFTRISQLHTSYLPQCLDRCRRIDQLNVTLSEALATATHLTAKVEALLKERAEMRAICQAEMLKHFFEVSRTMPPDQGKRYLAWVRENTCLRESAMDHGPANHAEKAIPAHRP
jgi:hypothetical protein